MAELKYGGSNVSKIMYGGQEFGGAAKLEPGTILYMSKTPEKGFKDVHLLSTTKNWNNLNSINIGVYGDNFGTFYNSINISGDDFKNLDKAKMYDIDKLFLTITVSRSIVDGEYRLNISESTVSLNFLIKAI
ncbi:hypothetical protein [Companilactobacillus farciminis]|uniref:hypothetical protein n=1 Tax=Companilactobacillus farciminis TaxID=1612 RepID=UPI00241DA74F|nr:hypothetical protein [Companilactobacillus farciminis]